MRRWFELPLVFLLLAPALRVVAQDTSLPPWRPDGRGDLAFYTSSFLATTAYRKPDTAADQFAADGAYGPLNRAWDSTHQGRWLIEEQRYASDAIIAGLITHRQDLIDSGRRIFDWGFRMEQPDGGFDCPDHFHSASFFIEAAAHSALLLQASDMAAQNKAWIESVAPKLNLAAHWMTDPRNEVPGRAHDAPYTHRFYLDAAAIGEAGVLTKDDALVKRSRAYIRDGIAHQRSDGANPEKLGTDTSYHVVGLLFAMNYYTLVANDDMRAQLSPMIGRGLEWISVRIRPDGTVDQSGNTRTGFGQERGPQGNLKTMSYGSAYRAFFYWAAITHNPAEARTAALLYAGQTAEKDQARRSNPGSF